MDEIDRAKVVEQQHRAAALAAQKQQAQQTEKQKTDEHGNVVCLDCDMIIPQARLEAKPDAARCVECKKITEKQERMTG